MMNEVQKRVLRNQHGVIMKSLVVDADLLSLLLQKEVLSETMVHTIQAKATQHEKVNELLMILPKKGPRAFNIFIEAARKYSPYLADKLMADFDKEQKLMSTNVPEAPKVPVLDLHPKDETSNDQPVKCETPRNPDKIFERRSPPKEISERRHSLSISSSNHAMTSSIIQQNLNMLYTKLKAKLPAPKNRDHSFASPEPVTFKMIDKLTDEVFHMLDEYETTIAQCHALLGGKDRNYPLVSHIINIQRSKRELEHEVKSKDQQKNKYADHISKLENRCRNQSTEINHLNAEVKRLKDGLERAQGNNNDGEEKQKIIDELRKMVMDADQAKRSRLRSGYLAIHYDSSSTEIKQLKAELRCLKMENDNLKNENVMLKKSESLKKLSKLREDSQKTELENKEDVQLFTKTKQPYPIQTNTPARGTVVKVDTEKYTLFQHKTADKPFMRMSADNLTVDNDDDSKAKQLKVKQPTDKEKTNPDLDFKFPNCENESLGHKRSTSKDRADKRSLSKDRSGKRVTFVSDLADHDKNDKMDTSAKVSNAHEISEGVDVSQAYTNETMSNSNGRATGSKSDKGQLVSRKKPSHLRAKSATRRSASLNSLSSSRDIMKMSSQLIQKSRNLRQNTNR